MSLPLLDPPSDDYPSEPPNGEGGGSQLLSIRPKRRSYGPRNGPKRSYNYSAIPEVIQKSYNIGKFVSGRHPVRGPPIKYKFLYNDTMQGFST